MIVINDFLYFVAGTAGKLAKFAGKDAVGLMVFIIKGNWGYFRFYWIIKWDFKINIFVYFFYF